MGGRAAERRGPWSLLLLLPLACSSAPQPSARDVADANDTGRSLAAKSDDERALLGKLAALPSGQPHRFGATTVVAEAAYTAASGRTCRALHLTRASTQVSHDVLACKNGNAWSFVPDVFAGEYDAERE